MVPIVPSVVGTLPTSTKPPFRTPSAVLRPDWVLVKNVTAAPGAAMGPDGVNFTTVVPRPWRFALLLKLLTRMSPGAIAPPAGNPLGTNATPYGLRSPLSGMVEGPDWVLVKNVTAAPGAAMGPDGVNFTTVVPRPWRFALLLKLLTRMSPGAIAPGDIL